jgi:hypothetical protein
MGNKVRDSKAMILLGIEKRRPLYEWILERRFCVETDRSGSNLRDNPIAVIRSRSEWQLTIGRGQVSHPFSHRKK